MKSHLSASQVARRGPSARWRLSGAALFVFAAWSGAQPQPAAAPPDGAPSPDVSQLGLPTLQQEADRRVKRQDYAGARPLLEELQRRLSASDRTDLQAQLEPVLFHLGMAHLFATPPALEPAIQAFDEYAKRFPSEQRLRDVLEYRGDAKRLADDWLGAAEDYKALLDQKRFRLAPQDSARVLQKVCDALFFARKFEEAIPWLEQMFATGHADDRGQAATRLIIALVETDQISEVFRWLPQVEGLAPRARNDIDFNLALLAAGDRRNAASDPQTALLFYQLVRSRDELLDWLDDERARLVALRANPRTRAEDVFPIISALNRIEAQRKRLEETGEYGPELRARIAQTFQKLERLWEAMWAYWSVWKTLGAGDLAETGASTAFQLAGQLEMDERAAAWGEQFLKDFPEGQAADSVSLALGKIYTRLEQPERAVALFKDILENKPNHLFASEIQFLTGYAYFQMDQLDEALRVFGEAKKVAKDDPESFEAASYWFAMCYLFMGRYEDALREFNLLETQLEGTIYGEDAVFRAASALYGLERFNEAHVKLEDYVRRFPDGSARAEVHSLLGDILAADGELERALAQYRQVSSYSQTRATLDYAAFQIGRILELQEDWAGIERHFRAYIEEHGTRGRYAEALWRIGFAEERQGHPERMLATYFDAIRRYGHDAAATGIDLILRDWLREFQVVHGSAPLQEAKSQLQSALDERKPALAWRWRMALHELGEPLAELPRVSDLDNASPAVLLWFSRLLQDSEPRLSRQALERILEDYGESDTAEDALLALGEWHAARQEFSDAITAFQQLFDREPNGRYAPIALKRQADVLRLQDRCQDAIPLYERILEVREWRGEIWAESLFRIGQCHFNAGRHKEAAAFFQRVHLLYGRYAEWVAPAYLGHVAALESLNVAAPERVKILQEMLRQKALAGRPEFQEAQLLLEKLQ